MKISKFSPESETEILKKAYDARQLFTTLSCKSDEEAISEGRFSDINMSDLRYMGPGVADGKRGFENLDEPGLRGEIERLLKYHYHNAPHEVDLDAARLVVEAVEEEINKILQKMESKKKSKEEKEYQYQHAIGLVKQIGQLLEALDRPIPDWGPFEDQASGLTWDNLYNALVDCTDPNDPPPKLLYEKIIEATAPYLEDLHAALEQNIADLKTQQEQIIASLETRIRSEAYKYLEVLKRKYKQMVYMDEYDTIELGRFPAEIEKFISKRLPDVDVIDAYGIILEVVQTDTNFEDLRSTSNAAITPEEYEALCAERLRSSGWTAITTKSSGDQGSDVIAEKDRKRFVLQCKLYNQPVGNKAVQEVIAAKQFEDADLAAVVTNANYTKSARLLAQSAGVLLLHHDDLVNFIAETLSDN